MVDPQQIQLVNALAQQANEAELERNSAKDRLDIARYRAQQPNVYRWRQHSAAWIFAGVVGMSGTVYALQKEAPYVIPMAAGAGLSVGLMSNAADKRRQTAAKQDRLEMCRYGLGEAEKHLRQSVTLYREEEETGWLMYALNTSKENLLALRTWMADPRRTMKDAVLESIDIVTTQYLGQPRANHRGDPRTAQQDERLNSSLTIERHYRQVRRQLFDEAIALNKDEFLANVFAKHHFLREQELQQAGLKAELFIQGAAVGVGSVTGLLAGAGMTALSAKAAAMGSSKVAIAAHGITGTLGITAVVGAGLLAAGTLHHWMGKADHQRRQREAQQFEEAFAATAQILETVMQAQTAQDLTERRTHLQTAYDGLNALKRQGLKGQDIEMKQYVEILSDRLQRSLKAIAKQQPLSSKLRLNLFSFRN